MEAILRYTECHIAHVKLCFSRKIKHVLFLLPNWVFFSGRLKSYLLYENPAFSIREFQIVTLCHSTQWVGERTRYYNDKFASNLFNIDTRWRSGPGSPVGIATGYGLDGPGTESRWGRDFPHHLSRPALRSTQPPVQWVPGLSQG
jgi:hypothetical protein